MRQILILASVIGTLAACNGNKTDKDLETPVVVLPSDTLYKNSAQSDTGTVVVTRPAPPKEINEEPAPVKTTPRKPVKTRSNSNNTPAPVVTAPAPVPDNTGTTTPANTGNETTTAPSPDPVTPEKKGISRSAKGAIIGGVGGAAAGAIISKKKGKGAIIGGVLGAAGGYIIGRKKDKKAAAADSTE